MKKIKLFMMLALLVMGVSGAWAQSYYVYKITYDLPEGLETAGYSLRTTDFGYYGRIYDNYPANGYITVSNYDSGGLNGTNVNDYIAPYAYMGFTSSTTVSNGTTRERIDGNYYNVYTITIKYTAVTDLLRWNDGVFEYCNYYEQSSGNIIKLDNDEVAIRLYLGDPSNTTEDRSKYTENVTDTVHYKGSEHSTGWQVDDDGDNVGDRAYFQYLSNHYVSGTGGKKYYCYKRTHDVACSKQTNVVIPATATDPNGKVHNVTAIQKWGFCYLQSHKMNMKDCDVTDRWWAIDDHSNRYLTTVTFADPSNLKYIGDYAFMSCTELKSIVLPNSIVYMGEGIFEQDYKLTDVRFQTRDDGTVALEKIKNFTFFLCTGMKSLELPDGILEIEGRQSGAAMQYMLSLKNVRLPNTLTKVGAHFLCCAGSLESLTLPASVTEIDGACFHGCEKLRNVYLLGPVSALQKEYKEDGSETASTTFSDNNTFCKHQVNNCTFWVNADDYDDYVNHTVWGLVNETEFNDDFTQVIRQWGDKNAIRKVTNENRVFPAKWVTAIFPYEVEDYASETNFGAGTRVAVMDPTARHTVTYEYDASVKKTVTVYNIVFKLIGTTNIPAKTPVMICPGKQTTYTMYTSAQAASPDFLKEASEQHPTEVIAVDGSKISMRGQYVPYTTLPWDFYFMYKDKTQNADGTWTYPSDPAKFYRVPDEDHAATVGICRCWWRLDVNNTKSDGGMGLAKGSKFFDYDETTGIDNIEKRIRIEGIYDLQGRKLDIKQSELPQGMYIVNGKKVVKQ